MRMLNYNHLRYFWAVAHAGNLTKTAAQLNLSQSALSVQIRKLEERLGHDLFERRGRQLHLTEAGRIALDHADAIFAAGDQLLGTLSGSGGSQQTLRVGALATLSRNFQIAFLRPLLARDGIEMILRSGSPAELLGSLEAMGLDVVLLNRAPDTTVSTSFIAHKIAEQRVSLIGTPKRVGVKIPIAKLLAQQPVILPTADNIARIGFDALTDRLGVRPRVIAEVDDMAMMRLLAREDAGLAIMPPVVVRDELSQGILTEAYKLPEATEAFYAVTMPRRYPNPLLSELLEVARIDDPASIP